MQSELFTPRLHLIALSAEQLDRCLTDLPALGNELNVKISANMTDEPVPRAIGMKLAKMKATVLPLHDWLTYWLIVLKDDSYGIGLIGFKGAPDAEGQTEIGYGIDAAYWNRGIMTEALQAMLAWAFSRTECRSVVAISVKNPRSERVLQKCGFRQISQQGEDTNWQIDRPG